MAIRKRKTGRRFWRHSDAPPFRQSGRRSVGRLQHCWRRRLEEIRSRPPAPGNTLDPTLPSSWIEIHPDNTILIRTGKSDFGQSTTFTAYRQIVAEELSAPFEAITTVVMGDTDRTPDGSGAFDFLGRGTPNIRKAAAYTYQALLDLASQRLGVPEERAFREGRHRFGRRQEHVVRRSGERPAIEAHDPRERQPDQHYGIDGHGQSAHEAGQPVHHHRQVLSEHASPRPKSPLARHWATDVRLPGMLHARMVHPKTLGSTLVSAGELDKTRFPNAQVVVKGNLVGVVAPTEWEAIRAAQQVASDTKWTDWKGLPGNANLFNYLRESADWKTTPVTKSDKTDGDVAPALAAAAKKLSATYEFSFMKHAPHRTDHGRGRCSSGRDGAHLHAQPKSPGAARRNRADARHYDRSRRRAHVRRPRPLRKIERRERRRGRRSGHPVEGRWQARARAVDAAPRTSSGPRRSPAAFADVEIGLDANGKIVAYQIDHYMPAGQDDRPVGAVIAGLPTMAAPARERSGGFSRLDGQQKLPIPGCTTASPI